MMHHEPSVSVAAILEDDNLPLRMRFTNFSVHQATVKGCWVLLNPGVSDLVALRQGLKLASLHMIRIIAVPQDHTLGTTTLK